MTISIAMATYNGAKYLKEQINSILLQTIQDFELIVCDDCSSDSTVDILEEYVRKDSRVRIYQNTNNIGFKKNFEKAIGLCRCDYIALCDQDDVWMPDHLEVLLSIIGENMIACGNANMIDASGNFIGLTLREMEASDIEFEDGVKKAYSLVYFRNPYQGASMLIKKEFFKIALPIPDDIGSHDSWFSVLSCFYGGLVYTNKIVNQYRMHGHNVTGLRTKRKSKMKMLIYQLVKPDGIFDRPAMIRTIAERVIDLNKEQCDFIQEANEIFSRASSFGGRILNTFFRIRHFKTIYNCK